MKYEMGKEFSTKLKIITSIDNTIDLNVKMDRDKVDIVANFWVVNHTHLELQFKDYEKDIPCALVPPISLDSSPRLQVPKMISKFTGSQLQVRVNARNSRWSKPCDCERAGTHDDVKWHNVSRLAEKYDIFFSVDSGPYTSRLGLTRIIHFHPKYLILNKATEDMFACQRGTQQKIFCSTNTPTPFYFADAPKNNDGISGRNDFICFSKSGNKWSKGIPVHRPGIAIYDDIKVTVDWKGARQLLICISKASKINRLENIDRGSALSVDNHSDWETISRPVAV